MTYNARIKNVRNNAITVTGSQLIVTGSIVSTDNITASVNLSASSIFTNNLTASTVSASTYLGLPVFSGSGSPGGPEQSVQFNSGSAFNGSSNLIFNYNTSTLSGTTAQFTTISGSSISGSQITGSHSGTTGQFTNLYSIQLSSSGITGSEANLDYIDFFTGALANPAFQSGRLYYDINSKELQFNTEIPTVSINLGQQLVVKVKNNTTGSIAKGKLVRVDGGIGANPTITLASWENDANSANTLGMVMQTVAPNDTSFVILAGVLTNIALDPLIYAAGEILYLSSSGDYTNVKPVAPKHIVKVGEIVRAHATEGAAFIKIDNGYELDELHNVLITSGTSGDLLVFNSGSQLWENKKQLTGSYDLTGSLTVTNTASASAGQFEILTGSTVTGNTAQFTNITGSVSGSLLGNSTTSTTLQTARTISSIGDVTWSVTFDGSGNVSGTAAIGTGVIVDADINVSASISDTKLATISTAGKVSNSATTATELNTANTIVARDASGNFSAGTISATFSGSHTGSISGSTAQFTSITGSELNAGSSGQFTVNTSGNITKINNVTTNFPSSQGGASTVLTNDGAGNLSWAAAGSSISTYSSSLGDGSSTSIVVTHSLNKSNILVNVRENSAGGYFVYPDIQYTSVNALTLTFATAPSSSQYLITVIGF